MTAHRTAGQLRALRELRALALMARALLASPDRWAAVRRVLGRARP
jgi:hypothetical protein